MKNKHSLKQLTSFYFILFYFILVHDCVCIMASYKQNIQPTFSHEKKIVDLDLTYSCYKLDKEELCCTTPTRSRGKGLFNF